MTASGPAPPPRAVLFDYGDTLITVARPDAAVDAAYRGICTFLARRPGRSVPPASELRLAIHDRLEAAVIAHAKSGELKEIDLPAAAASAFALIGLQLTPPELEEVARREQGAWWHGITVTPGAPEVLRSLRHLGMRIGILSNAPYPAASLRRQLDAVGLGDLIDSTTFSGEIGWRKPSPIIFEAALNRLGVAAGATIMVGDSAVADVGGARALGMRTVRLRQHRDDAGSAGEADQVIDRLDQLPPLVERWTAGRYTPDVTTQPPAADDHRRFAEYLKAKCGERQISLHRLALLCDLNQIYFYQAVNKNRDAPPPWVLRRAAPHLGVTYVELLLAAGHLTGADLSDWEQRSR